jgi:hypothetical protein
VTAEQTETVAIISAENEARSAVQRACARILVERGCRDQAGEIVLP